MVNELPSLGTDEPRGTLIDVKVVRDFSIDGKVYKEGQSAKFRERDALKLAFGWKVLAPIDPSRMTRAGLIWYERGLKGFYPNPDRPGYGVIPKIKVVALVDSVMVGTRVMMKGETREFSEDRISEFLKSCGGRASIRLAEGTAFQLDGGTLDSMGRNPNLYVQNYE